MQQLYCGVRKGAAAFRLYPLVCICLENDYWLYGIDKKFLILRRWVLVDFTNFITDMFKKQFNAGYKTPECVIAEAFEESVLCESPEGLTEDFGGFEDFTW